ncbi:MAG TPA: TonB-dependent receptor [Polyangiales bacterium]|nr:TonB-dependent receptor [Polyangiales bacterium]
MSFEDLRKVIRFAALALATTWSAAADAQPDQDAGSTPDAQTRAGEPPPPSAAPPPPPPSPEPPSSAPPAAAQPEQSGPAEPPAAAATPLAEPTVPLPSAAAETLAEVPPLSEQDAVDIIVVGNRLSRAAGSAHVMRAEQLERFEFDDAHAALLQVPGVYVRQEDGIGLRPNIGIRGANPDRSKKLTLMEDGVLFGPAPYSAPAAYYFPLLTRMTQIRVIDGPSAIAYGPQTVGGAIDFITRSLPDVPTAAIDLAGGQYGYRKAHAYAGTTEGRFGMLIEGVHLHDSGFKELPDGADTGSTRNEWMVKASYVIDPTASATHELGLKLTYSEETSNETYLGLSDEDFRADPNQRYPASALDQMKNHRTSIVAGWIFDAPDSKLKITTTAYRHDYARIWRKVNRFRGAAIAGVLAEPDDPNNAEYLAVLKGREDTVIDGTTILIGPNDRTFVNEGVQSVLELNQRRTGPVTHRIEAGLRAHHDSIDRRHSEDAFSVIEGQLVPNADEATYVTASNEANTYALAMHALDAMSWGKFTLTPGVRLELISSQLDDRLAEEKNTAFTVAVMPGVGAFYELVPNLGVLAGLYRGFSPPAPGDDVEPEYSLNYEAGVRYSPGRSRAELIGFLNDYSNLTDICTFSSGCVTEDLDRQFDTGKALIYGFEAFLGHDLDLGAFKLPFGAAYTFTHAEFRSTFQSSDPIYGNVSKGDELPYVPEHQLSVTLGIDGKIGALNAALTYVAAMREEAGSQPLAETLATDEQITVDLAGELRILERLKIYASVRNVGDARNIVSRRPFGARPNAPRWVHVGIKGAL